MKWKAGVFTLVFLGLAVLTVLSVFDIGISVSDILRKWSRKGDGKLRVKRQRAGLGDESQLPYEVITSTLPMTSEYEINHRYMPTLGNGLLATTVYSDKIYLNGLYNGEGSSSHRAEIPAMIMLRVSLSDELEKRATRKYIFNAKEGIFKETIDSDYAYIEHRTYMHQKYIRILVTDIYAYRKENALGSTILYLNYMVPAEHNSPDITFQDPVNHQGSSWKMSGRTKTSEPDANTEHVHMFWMEQQQSISLDGHANKIRNVTMVMSVDKVEASAKTEFDNAVYMLNNAGGHYRLLKEHKDAWARVWNGGRIEIDGDKAVSKAAFFSQYYLLSSLPAQYADLPPQHSEVFYGLARNSLAKGAEGKDYQGHIFWDSEVYVLPAIVMFYPETAKKMLRYRSYMANQAKKHAEAMGHDGYRYPWESAFSGNDVTPDNCKACRDQQLHVSAAVAWGIRQYFSATRDRDYMTNPDYNGCDITREISRFYSELTHYNTREGRYDIHGMMGPDDWHVNQTNNAYVNVMVSLAIHWARYFACMCQRNDREEVPDESVHMALYLNLPYDNVKRFHYLYQGYENNPNKTVKQADTIMLTFPLRWNMSLDIMRNDLQYYEQYTSPRTPAMTMSFFAVGWKMVAETQKIDPTFLKSYHDYMVEPFKVWTEYNEQSEVDQKEGSVNYLPGMGAFLQSLMFGFGGIWLRPQILEVHDPMPPPNCDRIRLIGFKYLGSNMTIEIERSGPTRVTLHELGEYPLMLKINDSTPEQPLKPGSPPTEIENRKGFYIYNDKGSPCEHPRDYIYMPWGYSPMWSSAPTTSTSTSTSTSACDFCDSVSCSTKPSLVNSGNSLGIHIVSYYRYVLLGMGIILSS